VSLFFGSIYLNISRVGERLITKENPFDEANYVLGQYSGEIIWKQLFAGAAKSGSKFEAMKVSVN
jgi:hypothetical protein